MHARSIIYAAVLAACSPTVWAATGNVEVYGSFSLDVGLPTHEIHSEVTESSGSFFDRVFSTSTPGETVTITPAFPVPAGNGYTVTARTNQGSNHLYAQASTIPLGSFGVGGLSAWYDRATITGGVGTGTAQFTVQLNGVVDVGSIVGLTSYSLTASSLHPSLIDYEAPASTPFTPVLQHVMFASPYNDTAALAGLFAPSIDGSTPPDESVLFGASLILKPGSGQVINTTLTGTFNFNYGEAFYLTSVFNADLINTSLFTPFCPFSNECPAPLMVDGTGATTLDFSNSANLVGIVLPEGATASFASGNDYNVTAVPEPGEWLMMLAGLGLVAWRARRRNAVLA